MKIWSFHDQSVSESSSFRCGSFRSGPLNAPCDPCLRRLSCGSHYTALEHREI